MSMPNIDYPWMIQESEEDLEKLEKRHRYGHLFHRVRMLGLEVGGVREPLRSPGLQLASMSKMVRRLPPGW